MNIESTTQNDRDLDELYDPADYEVVIGKAADGSTARGDSRHSHTAECWISAENTCNV